MGGGAAVAAFDDVVDVAAFGGDAAAGVLAVAVADLDGAAQGRGRVRFGQTPPMDGDDDELTGITRAMAADVRAIRQTLQLWSAIAGGLLLLLLTLGLIWAVG